MWFQTATEDSVILLLFWPRTERHALLASIFYAVYKPLYSELQQYLDSNPPLVQLIQANGLTHRPTVNLLAKSVGSLKESRIRFLQSHLNGLNEMYRANGQDIDMNLRLMVSAKLVAQEQGREFSHQFETECVESAWKRNTSVLSQSNLQYAKQV